MMISRIQKFSTLILVLSLIALQACTADDAVGPVTENSNIELPSTTGVYVLNEGNYAWGNGSLSFYNPTTQQVSNQLFNSVNNRPLGDVPQSAYVIGDKLYMMINNSNKIEVVDKNTMESLSKIDGFVSPRYLLPVGENKAYVTDLYGDKISVLDLESNAIVSEIPLEGWTDELILSNEKVFVQNIDEKKIVVIDPVSDKVVQEYPFESSPIGVVEDQEGNVLTVIKNKFVRLVKNDADYTVESHTLPNIDAPSELRIDKANHCVYFINNGVYKIDLTKSNYNAERVIEQKEALFYGMGIDPSSGEIYVTDAKDYVQIGSVLRYTKDGELIDEFEVGVIPQDITFKQ